LIIPQYSGELVVVLVALPVYILRGKHRLRNEAYLVCGIEKIARSQASFLIPRVQNAG
jgi:hypothetical protein